MPASAMPAPDLAAPDLAALPLDALTKGIPAAAAPLALGDIGRQGWNLLAGDLPLPLLLLREPALAHNERWMHGFLARTGAAIAPHGKTTMSPQLFRRQLEAGAWAITVATVQQLEVCRRFGVKRVLLANQLVGWPAIRAVTAALAADPDFAFWCLVDSLDGVAALEAGCAEAGLKRPLCVLLEAGVAGGRTGCRDRETALAVARAVRAAPHLALAGVEGFEGLIQGESEAAREAAVAAFLEVLAGLAEACDAEGLFEADRVLLTAGGSSFFDLVAGRLGAVRLSRPSQVVTRSGCYLTHDSGLYGKAFARMLERSPDLAELGEGPRPALELWSLVQSRPEPGKAILSFGKRDAGFDAGLPVPERWHRPGGAGAPEALAPGHRVTKLHDQHAELALPPESEGGSPLKVGDLVACGISHPCTTFDKWRLVFTVDDAYGVTGGLATFF
ncbi:D-serine dehydratase [Tistlia consotensis]|uniref:D-serine dehydratase n=1 Tax=Tistlia consotensis USBA 355 TaxID=560819 RepID=A0A1Y6CG26_9PROT|nr:amino acid deaminase [Tistlia consotensis]SMF53289.1 D-serine dehydratase [Tistlia consotensis USBA 355]SNR85331.1 D-serine dehydratase [Tistlia consotensis]